MDEPLWILDNDTEMKQGLLKSAHLNEAGYRGVETTVLPWFRFSVWKKMWTNFEEVVISVFCRVFAGSVGESSRLHLVAARTGPMGDRTVKELIQWRDAWVQSKVWTRDGASLDNVRRWTIRFEWNVRRRQRKRGRGV